MNGAHGMSKRSAAVVGLLVLGGCGTLATGALANDGGIALGGSPGLLKNHPSVTMTSEVIKITVEDEKVTVDCSFVFTNHGPACSARMGFPDQGVGAFNPDEEEDSDTVMHTPPRTTFTTFHSYVDGKPVATKLIRADQPGRYWHTKIVSFPANGVRQVHDVYTQSIGGGIASIGSKYGSAQQVGYILHTGASWHGPIGRSEVDVMFRCKEVRGTPMPIAFTTAARGKEALDAKANVLAANTVVWKGACAPTVTGNTLQFVRTNWRPTERDDLELTYGYKFMAEDSSSSTVTAKK